MPRRSVTRSALLAIGLGVLTASAAVSRTMPPEPDLIARLPATIEGQPVELVASGDLGTWLATVFPDQSHPQIDALTERLAEQGLSVQDVATVTAFFSADQGGSIEGFAIPGGDATSWQDVVAAAYLIGLGDLERTERQVGDRSVTFLSEGPLDTASYPFAVLPDAGVLWIVVAETSRVIDALEALLAVAAGTAPGHTGTLPTPTPRIGPATWFGTMRGTVTWAKGAYVGEATAEFRGTWERIDDESIGYCPDGPCDVYRPMGEIVWRFESAAPGPPSCRTRRTGSVSAGEVVIPQDQMLYLAPAGADHVRYWGSGTLFLPPQDCPGWEGISAPDAFFDIPIADEDDPFADVSGAARPLCPAFDWRIEREAAELRGTCWRYDLPGYEQRFEWDLRRVGPE